MYWASFCWAQDKKVNSESVVLMGVVMMEVVAEIVVISHSSNSDNLNAYRTSYSSNRSSG